MQNKIVKIMAKKRFRTPKNAFRCSFERGMFDFKIT